MVVQEPPSDSAQTGKTEYLYSLSALHIPIKVSNLVVGKQQTGLMA